MIEIKLTGKCKDCPFGVIEVERLDSFDHSTYFATCKHEPACDRIEEMNDEQTDRSEI